MSPGSRSASATSRMTRARPSMSRRKPVGRPAHQPATVSSVRPGDDLAIRREHPGRRERLIRPERVLALADELVIHLQVVRAHDILELLEPEEEDVFLSRSMGLHQTLGFLQQGLLVHEVAADHAVLRIFPVPGESPHPVNHAWSLRPSALPARRASAPAAPAPSSCLLRPCSKRR